jgi:prepilin-type N-terminal cleavage/methylation domain-containing protein
MKHNTIMTLRTNRRAGFTLVELVAVVTLLAILGTGALLGLKHHRESANFRKVVRDLNAIDLAKQTWQTFHPTASWPGNETDRWGYITNYLGTTATGTEAPIGSGYFSYEGYSPEGFSYQIGGLTNPSTGLQGSQAVKRPL